MGDLRTFVLGTISDEMLGKLSEGIDRASLYDREFSTAVEIERKRRKRKQAACRGCGKPFGAEDSRTVVHGPGVLAHDRPECRAAAYAR